MTMPDGLDAGHCRSHRCDERHRQDHGGRLAASEADTFEAEFRLFLATPHGRFEVYYATRSRP
jgi:hypothetical protein